MTEKQLIEKVFDLVKDYEGDFNDLLKSVIRKVNIYQTEEQEALRKRNKAEMEKIAAEIFELCPSCNFIPVAIESGSGEEFVTDPNLNSIWECCFDYLMDREANDAGLVMPHQCDDMTFGAWKRIDELWEKMVELAGYKYKTSNDGDYCEFYHLSVYGFSKETKKIEEHYDINR